MSTNLYFEILSVFCVIVNFAISSAIELLKQTWFLLAGKDSQTEGSIAN